MATDKAEYKILIIEDNPGDFALEEDFIFEHIVAPVITQAVTFKAAMAFLETDFFDVVLLDLSLPDKTGEALIHEIIEICKNIPVIVLTGYADINFGAKSLTLGIADYLLKDDLTSMSLYKSIIYSIKRKQNLTQLEESEKRYSDLFNLSPLPMWVVDTETLKFLDVNAATVAQYGFNREEFMSMTLNDIRPPDEIPPLLKHLEDDKNGQNTAMPQLVIHKTKHGELRNVQIDIALINYKGVPANLVTATDITDRLNYTKAIERQNERLKEISWIQSHIVRAPLSRMMGLIPLLTDLEETVQEKKKMMDFIMTSANELDEIIKTITDKSKVEDFQNLRNETRE